jgi:polyisoprenoid-binding protein YceI
VSARATAPTVFEVQPGRSAVLVKARSSVGPISFATSHLRGAITAELEGKAIDLDSPITAELTVSLRELTSGNTLYDTELKRRIDARRYPEATLHLEHASRTADESNRFELSGRIELHAVVRPLLGVVTVERLEHDMMVIRGQQMLDIREFELDVPTMLALKIFPEVSVEMHLEARAQ